MILSSIVAYTRDANNRLVIGKGGKVPWHIPRDMLWFKEHTRHNAVIMGRKTHESIGRILPDRDNIILTRQKDYFVPGAFVFNDLEEAIHFADQRKCEVFIIGGEELYKQTINKVDRIYITFIKKNPGCKGDTFFPDWDREQFKSIYNEAFEDSEYGKIIFTIFQRIVYKGKLLPDDQINFSYRPRNFNDPHGDYFI